MDQFIQDITKEAGKVVLEMFGKVGVKYTKKDSTDVVTEADLKSNEILINRIKEAYPDHGIVSEEIPEEDWKKEKDKEYVWIIDPLDGTRNFSTNVPIFGVVVALVHNGEVELAAVYLPVTDELYFAKKGEGAYLNGEQIHCSSKETLKETFGAVWSCVTIGSSLEIVQALIDNGKKECYWFGALSSMAATFSYVAGGRRDWYVGPRGMGVWDVAAPLLILRESGCKVTNLKGDEFNLWDSEDIIVANPILHEKILQMMNR